MNESSVELLNRHMTIHRSDRAESFLRIHFTVIWQIYLAAQTYIS